VKDDTPGLFPDKICRRCLNAFITAGRIRSLFLKSHQVLVDLLSQKDESNKQEEEGLSQFSETIEEIQVSDLDDSVVPPVESSVDSKHQILKSDEIICEICGKTYKKKYFLCHVRTHNKKDKKFQCKSARVQLKPSI
jgi:hypothetical protein